MTGFAATLTLDEVDALKARADVVDVHLDTPVSISDTQANPTWGLDRIDQRSTTRDGKYSYDTSGAGVTAYVIDTGVNFRHNDFTNRFAESWDFIGDGESRLDCNGHGTHVAGTIGGTTYGVAKKVSLVSLRVLDCFGDGYTSTTVAALEWVAENAVRPSVVNMSLGGGYSYYVDMAVRNLVAAGIPVVVAAGNDSFDACYFSPSGEPSAITVAATDQYDSRAAYSNYGSCVDIFAPGTTITSASNTSNTGSKTLSGTSMAAPHVAGLVARYLQNNRAASVATVTAAIQKSATPNVVWDSSGYGGGLAYGAPEPKVLPGKPGSVTATRNDTAFSATLKWKAPASSGSSKITGYRVSRDGTDANGAGPSSATVSATTVSKTFANLVPGKTYKLSVQAITSAGTGSATSVSVTMPKAKALTAKPVPKVSGTGKVGQTLTAKAGTWGPNPVALTYQWNRGGTAIKGATSYKYKLVTADAGKSITVSVTGRKTGYIPATKTSTALKVATLKLTAAATPKIAGTGAVGQTLTASVGTWSPSPVTFSYQWKRNGVVIPKATSRTYKLVSGDAGKKITVSITGKKDGYASQTKTSVEKYVQTWVEAKYGTFTAKTYKGTGDDVVTLPKGATAAIVTATYSGGGFFYVSTLDSRYQTAEYLMSSYGEKYSGSMAYGLSEFSERSVRLEIEADGPWTVKVAPLSTAKSMPTSGTGDKVFLYTGSAGRVTLSHNGKQWFEVTQYTNEEYGQYYLAYAGGAYKGTVPIYGGPSVIEIEADGKWSTSVRR